MESHDERIGRLVQRNAANKALIAGLRDSIKCISDQLNILTEQLNDIPESLDVDPTAIIRFAHVPGEVRVNILNDLREKIAALKKALKDREHMESCLKEAGLGDLISSSDY